jgi:hypothetical protein
VKARPLLQKKTTQQIKRMRDNLTKAFSPILGVVVSVTTFEIWQNIVISLVVAFCGGFLAFVGQSLAKKILKK